VAEFFPAGYAQMSFVLFRFFGAFCVRRCCFDLEVLVIVLLVLQFLRFPVFCIFHCFSFLMGSLLVYCLIYAGFEVFGALPEVVFGWGWSWVWSVMYCWRAVCMAFSTRGGLDYFVPDRLE